MSADNLTTSPQPTSGTDASDRMRDLEEQVALYSQILDAIPDLILYKGPHSHIRYANKAFRDYYAMSMDALHNLIDAPFNEPDYTLQYIKDDQHVFSTGETLQIEEPVTRHDGEVNIFSTIKVPIAVESATIGTLGISRNVSDQKSMTAALQASEERLRRITANVPGMVYQFLLAPDGTTSFPYVSEGSREIYGLAPEVIYRDANAIIDLIHPDDRADFSQSVGESARTLNPWLWEGRALVGTQEKWLEGKSRPTRLADGSTLWDGVLMDGSVGRRAELERVRLQEELIHAQANALAELSTPLIRLNQTTLMMPLIGSIDTQRAGHVITSLLEGVSSQQAQVAILDLTGVPVVDTQVAAVLIRAAQSARLLGAEVILTGIRPEIAQTLVALGVDLGQVVTRSNLQMGIEYALVKTERRR